MTLKIILSIGFLLVGALVYLIERGTFSWERRMRRRGVLFTDARGNHFIIMSRSAINPLRMLAAMESDFGYNVGAFCDAIEMLPDDRGWSYVPLELFIAGMYAITYAVKQYPDNASAQKAFLNVAGNEPAGFDSWLEQMDEFINEFE